MPAAIEARIRGQATKVTDALMVAGGEDAEAAE